ncbi:MAG: alpha/beta hydrolase [Candidatus Binataceae bacterium]
MTDRDSPPDAPAVKPLTLDEYLAEMDPELRAVYSPLIPFFEAWPYDAREARRLQASLMSKEPPCDGIARENLKIPGRDASAQIPARLYSPARQDKSRGCVLWIHGGGWSCGSIDDDDRRCDRIADEARVAVVSVGYRLAPEYPFPAGLNDCYRALEWIAENATALRVDPARIAVAGASAGGNLAAAVALMARDQEGPSLALQLLIYPALDSRMQAPSTHAMAAKGIVLDRSMALFYRSDYLGPDAETNTSPYAAPVLAQDLAGLPASYLMVGGLDLLRDDAVTYATRLMHSRVRAELHVYPGAFHGFDKMVPDAAISRRATADYIRALRGAVGDVAL